MTLSGELPTKEFLSRTGGVGLLRSEYLIRNVGLSWAADVTRRAVADHVSELHARLDGRPLWYRFCDLEARDVAVLADAPETSTAREDNPIIGRRALRRDTGPHSDLDDEIRVLAALAYDLPGLGLVAPFVRDEREVAGWIGALRAHGCAGPFGAMIEIPSAVARLEQIIDAGVSYLVVGMNDLTGLLLGAGRGTGLYDYHHPAVLDAVRHVCRTGARRGVTVRIAGNFGREVPSSLPELPISAFSWHYQDWAEFRPDDAALAAPDRDMAARLRKASDERLIAAGLMEASNAVRVAGMRAETVGRLG
ncbi:putative PEP-binding protein [Micromonospora sp. CPCC 205546]|uniref:putative PEP-binding protein n=1 Tax=Micromonospora sp. CPCC 205546 TaxID=3122397 RepID=UPI002FF196D9